MTSLTLTLVQMFRKLHLGRWGKSPFTVGAALDK